MIGEQVIKRLALIGSLSDEDRDALRSIAGETRELARGEDVLTEGEQPHESIVVLTGLLCRYKLTPQGARQIHSFYIPTDTPCFETLPMEFMDNNLAAVVPSRIGAISHGELYRVMAARPHLQTLIWRETLVQGAMFREWMTRNSQMLAHAQMAHFFCEIMARSRAAGLSEGDSCALPITQEELADALGMTPVHVNRTLQVLRAGDFVEFRSGRLTVRDWDRLAELAEFEPSYLHLHG